MTRRSLLILFLCVLTTNACDCDGLSCVDNCNCGEANCTETLQSWLQTVETYSDPWLLVQVSPSSLDLRVALSPDALAVFRKLDRYTCDILIYPGQAFELAPICSALFDQYGRALALENAAPIRQFRDILGRDISSFSIRNFDLPNRDSTGVKLSCRAGKQFQLKWDSKIRFPPALKTPLNMQIGPPKITIQKLNPFRAEASLEWSCPRSSIPRGYEINWVVVDSATDSVECSDCIRSNLQCRNCFAKQTNVEKQRVNWKETMTSFMISRNLWSANNEEISNSTHTMEMFDPSQFSWDSVMEVPTFENSYVLATVRGIGRTEIGPWSEIGVASLNTSNARPPVLLQLSLTSWDKDVQHMFLDPRYDDQFEVTLKSKPGQQEVEIFDLTANLSSDGCYHPISKTWFYAGENRVLAKPKGGPEITLAYREKVPLSFQCSLYSRSIIWTEEVEMGFRIFSGTVDEDLTKLSDIKPLNSSCNRPVSAATGIRRRDGNEELLLVAEDGVYALLIDGQCRKLIFGANLEGQGINLGQITSLAGDYKEILLLEGFRAGIHVFDATTGFFLRTIAEIFTPRPSQLYDFVPNTPTQFLLPLKLNQSLTRIRSDNGLTEPVPPNCLYPQVTVGGIEMLSKDSARISIGLSWAACPDFLHPTTSVIVKYKETDKSEPCRSFKCFCASASCYKSGVETRELQVDVPLRLESGQRYHLEISAEPSLDQSLMERWFDFPMGPTVVRDFAAEFVEERKNSGTALTLLLILLAVSVIGIGVLLYLYRTRWYVYRSLAKLEKGMVKIERPIGQGHFGEVYEAKVVLKNKRIIPAAVKSLKVSNEKNAKQRFLEEAILISKMDHPHIIKTIGICLDSKPILLALEYMNGGSLEGYLRKVDQRETLSFKDLMKISIWIAKGCAYLEEKGCIHRDLAARNVLIELDDYRKPRTAKISDFGLAKDSKFYTVAGQKPGLPYCTAAPECFPPEDEENEKKLSKFSTKSDVWAFGVLLYEIFTLGMYPFFPWHSDPNTVYVRVRDWVVIQRRTILDMEDEASLEIAEFIPEVIRAVMRQCMGFEPELRPSFSKSSKERPSLLNLLNVASGESPTLVLEPPSPENGSDFYIVEEENGVEGESSSLDQDMIEADVETISSHEGNNVGVVFHPMKDGLNSFGPPTNGVKIHTNREGKAEVTV